ncbi:MAG: riboflavin synthase [Alphaproteobacteria bacterium]|nr:riboflavin synthase [Alphaproteobacteria bacterium]
MFTGIITDLGRVTAVERAGDTRFAFATGYDMSTVEIGASIACSGPCLTVIEKGPGWFAAKASAETLARTTLGSWKAGTHVNFERPLSLGAELGGHLVTGHIDATALVISREPEGDSVRFVIETSAEVAPYIAAKGSVALDGVSLTVNEVRDIPGGGARFGVNIIEHTRVHTTFGALAPGDRLNLEVDLLARYAARLAGRS